MKYAKVVTWALTPFVSRYFQRVTVPVYAYRQLLEGGGVLSAAPYATRRPPVHDEQNRADHCKHWPQPAICIKTARYQPLPLPSGLCHMRAFGAELNY